MCEVCGSKEVVKVWLDKWVCRIICKACGTNVYYEVSNDREVSKVPKSQVLFLRRI